MRQFANHYFKIYQPDDETPYFGVFLIDKNLYEKGIRFNKDSFQGTELHDIMEEHGFEEVNSGYYQMTSKVSEKYVRTFIQTLGFLEI